MIIPIHPREIRFHHNLKHLRQESKMSQGEVAAALGIKISRYRDWEYGKSEPSFEYIGRLRVILQASLEYLFFNEEGSK